jgi:DNA-binding transcriptional LysR family regulator
MELRHLRYAVALADALNFRRAAEQLGMSQPPLSQQIRQLEEELGTPLFTRTKRQVRITEAGRIFTDEARLILAHAEHASSVAARVKAGHTGQLVVGVVAPANAPIVVDVLSAFRQQHRTVRILLRQLTREQQIQALRERRIHVGLVPGPLDDPDLSTMRVLSKPMMIALPAKHPLARRGHIRPADLAQEAHVLFLRNNSPVFFDSLIAASRQAGLPLTVMHEADSLLSAFALVAAGFGVCLVPSGFVNPNARSVAMRPLRPALRFDAQLLVARHRDDESELVRSFLNVVQEVAVRHQ